MTLLGKNPSRRWKKPFKNEYPSYKIGINQCSCKSFSKTSTQSGNDLTKYNCHIWHGENPWFNQNQEFMIYDNILWKIYYWDTSFRFEWFRPMARTWFLNVRLKSIFVVILWRPKVLSSTWSIFLIKIRVLFSLTCFFLTFLKKIKNNLENMFGYFYVYFPKNWV